VIHCQRLCCIVVGLSDLQRVESCVRLEGSAWGTKRRGTTKVIDSEYPEIGFA